jgi:hypothetical protein
MRSSTCRSEPTPVCIHEIGCIIVEKYLFVFTWARCQPTAIQESVTT